MIPTRRLIETDVRIHGFWIHFCADDPFGVLAISASSTGTGHEACSLGQDYLPIK